jgi:acetylornithine/succinyldiaminopimelate/putrescine aminotransferase
MDVAQRDRLYLAREEAAEGMQIARSQGGFLFDQHGKRYLDFTAGWCVGIALTLLAWAIRNYLHRL